MKSKRDDGIEATTPYLTIVTTSRNDNHGGNLLYRMQLFVNGLLEQCQRHQLQAELVLVEWNPPADKPRLAKALSWPENDGHCAVRIIEVPPETHRRFKHSEALPLFQMIAKNVGIQRARGRFVLATNIDILFSDELIHFLASWSLKPGLMCRIDRYDVSADVPVDAPIDEQLEYCRRHVIRICTQKGTRYPGQERQPGYFRKKYLWWQGYFRKKYLWWQEYFRQKRYQKLFRAEQRAIVMQNLWKRFEISPAPFEISPARLHTNACGDFTLMAREQWLAVRGYPEFEMFSMHLDSLLCYIAHHAGCMSKVLTDPMRIYHIEHSPGSGWTPEGKDLLNKRLHVSGIPQLDDAQLRAWAIQMRKEHRPIIFNNENWGLRTEDLVEINPYTLSAW